MDGAENIRDWAYVCSSTLLVVVDQSNMVGGHMGAVRGHANMMGRHGNMLEGHINGVACHCNMLGGHTAAAGGNSTCWDAKWTGLDAY